MSAAQNAAAPGGAPSSSVGFGWGALAGLGGALGMAVVSSIVVAVIGGVSEGPGTGFGLLVVYTLFGVFFAAIIGPIGGGLLGFGLAVLKRASAAPLVGALTPPIVIVPAALVWAAVDEGSKVLEALAIIGCVAVLYAPLGFLAGKFYARKMLT